MQKSVLFPLLLLTSYCLQAQEISIQSKAQGKLDSLNKLAAKQWFTDSLSVLAWGDSLKTGVEAKTRAAVNKVNHGIDSLKNLKLPTDKLTQKIDSINQKKDQLLASVNNKQQELLTGTKKKLNDWQGKLKTKLGFNTESINSTAKDLTGKALPNVNLPGSGLNLPTNQLSSQLPDVNLPIKDLNLSAEDLKIPSLQSVDFQNMDLPKDLGSINQSLPFTKIDGLQEWQGKISGVTGKASMLEGIKTNPDKVIENAAANVGQMKDVQKVLNTNALEQSEYGAIVKNIKDEEAMTKMVVNEVKKDAMNHFAGKEQVLQSAMAQVSKYKQSYSSISSLSEIKKRPPNPMKGKPLVERLVPGIAIQIHVKNYLNFDFNPYVAYRLTGRLSAGVGWNQRFAMDWSNKNFIPEARVYGPRVFGEYKLQRGFTIRLEGEVMNTYIPPYSQAPGEGKREWVYTTMTGLKKEYRFFKKVKGFTLVQFDLIKLFIPNHQSPYGDVVNARFGFEFPLKKKNKQPKPRE